MRLDHWIACAVARLVRALAGLWCRWMRWPRKVISYYFLISCGVETGFGWVELIGFPLIRKAKGSRIRLGPGVTLISKSSGNVAGINHPVILATLGPGAVIEIAGPFGASGSAIVAAERVTIGPSCGLGANSHIYDTDFHAVGKNWQGAVRTGPVILEENVWVAAGCMILKGVTLGRNCVIGAGSIVTRSVEPFTVAAGNPARAIRKFE